MSAHASNGQGHSADFAKPPLIVVITGAAGRIAYSLIPLVCNGSTFGKDRRIDLRLIDVEFSMTKLEGVLMEIQDSNYFLLENVSIGTSPTGFMDADVAVLLGGYPRMPGMERKNLIEKNAEGMQLQGLSLEKYAKRDVKVLVVANPANTNMLVLLKTVTTIPKGNFSCLTRLDEERLRFVVADKINRDLKKSHGGEGGGGGGRLVRAQDVKNVFIFGNHSTTQVPFIEVGTAVVDGEVHKVKSFFTKEETDELISSIQNRGGEVIKKQGLSSGLSAAGAIVRHLGDLFAPSKGPPLLDISDTAVTGINTFSAGVLSTGNPYGVPDGMVYSFPCYLHNGEIRIVPNLKLSAETTARLAVSTAELQGERVEAENFLTALPTPKL